MDGEDETQLFKEVFSAGASPGQGIGGLRPSVRGEGSSAVCLELALTQQGGGNQDMRWSWVRGRAPAHLLWPVPLRATIKLLRGK